MKLLYAPSPSKVRRMEQEYQALGLLDAPSRIPRSDLDGFFPVTLPNGATVHCLVMERIEGKPLNQWLDERNRLTQEQALNWLRQLIELIAVVHKQRYFHRDVKPDNLILQPNGTLALVDFGACRRLTDTYLVKLRMGGDQLYAGSATSTYTITAVGSAGYSPIEQLHGRGVPQSDFFAIARTLVHLLTQRHPSQIPVDGAGQLQWRNFAHVAPPLADLIDELQHPSWQKRPLDAEVVLQRIDRLPGQIKRYQIRTSVQFKIATVLGGLLTMGLATWGFSSLAAYQRSAEAQRYVDLGIQNQLRGETSLARQNYEAALKIDPNLPEVQQNLALVCQKEGNFDCAIDRYNQALKLAPNGWPIYYNLANLYEEQGNYDKAEEYYKKVIQNSDLTLKIDAANNLARLYNLQGKTDEAIKITSQNLPITRDQVTRAALLKNLGWGYLLQSKPTDSIRVLSEAQQLDPQRADISCLLAQAYTQRKATELANSAWKSCLLLDPGANLPEVKRWRQQFLDKLL